VRRHGGCARRARDAQKVSTCLPSLPRPNKHHNEPRTEPSEPTSTGIYMQARNHPRQSTTSWHMRFRCDDAGISRRMMQREGNGRMTGTIIETRLDLKSLGDKGGDGGGHRIIQAQEGDGKSKTSMRPYQCVSRRGGVVHNTIPLGWPFRWNHDRVGFADGNQPSAPGENLEK
jgi:hypothetical protein